MCIGAGLGLAGTAPLFLFLPALVAATAFAVVVPFGLLEFLARPRSTFPATVGLWFAFLGGMSSVVMTWVAGGPSSFSTVAVTSGTIGIVGMSVCLIGVGSGRVPGAELSGSILTNRTWVGAILVCIGGTLGLVGSGVAFGFLFSLLGLTCFTLVLLFGVRLFRKGPESRILSAATLYFALVGVGDIVFYLPYLVLYGTGAVWPFYVRPIGTLIALLGAIVLLRRPRGEITLATVP
jgi:hypothetical protein